MNKDAQPRLPRGVLPRDARADLKAGLDPDEARDLRFAKRVFRLAADSPRRTRGEDASHGPRKTMSPRVGLG